MFKRHCVDLLVVQWLGLCAPKAGGRDSVLVGEDPLWPMAKKADVVGSRLTILSARRDKIRIMVRVAMQFFTGVLCDQGTRGSLV